MLNIVSYKKKLLNPFQGHSYCIKVSLQAGTLILNAYGRRFFPEITLEGLLAGYLTAVEKIVCYS